MSPSTKSRQLGKLVRQARTARGLSLRALAEGIGTADAPYLLRLERGEYQQPSAAVLQGLARVLDIAITDLYALAGYVMPEGLPAFEPYLRVTTDLPDHAIEQLGDYYAMLKTKYGAGANGPEGGDDV